MNRRDCRRVRSTQLLALVAVSAAMFATVASPSSADVTAVSGSAYGYSASFTIFGGGPFVFGPDPTVTLPAGGSAVPITATAPSGRVAQGPGVLFTSGPIDVSTQGTTGATGSVTSSSHITTVPTSTVGEILYAGDIRATCTASEAGVSGTTTLAGPGDAGHTSPTLRTSDGNPDVEGDETYVDLPTDPAPNTTIDGTLESVGDTYRVVLNEQIPNPDGSLTVNAVHEYLLGPTAVGELIIGQVVCGVTATGVTTTTNGGVTTTTTNGGVTTTTTLGGGVTTTTTLGGGVTTTTLGGGGGGRQTTTTIRIGALSRTGSDNDLMIAWAAMALTLGGLLLIGAKSLPGPAAPPPEPERREGPRRARRR